MRNHIFAIHKWSRFMPLFSDPRLIEQPSRNTLYLDSEVYERARVKYYLMPLVYFKPLTLNLIAMVFQMLYEFNPLFILPCGLVSLALASAESKTLLRSDIMRIDLLRLHAT